MLKNRYGEADVEVGCAFYGRCGLWKELPKSDEIYDYDIYLDAKYMKRDEQTTEVAKQEDECNKQRFNFLM